ncbi:MAG: penicillin-binding protein 1C [Pseudomarimonas sp.]
MKGVAVNGRSRMHHLMVSLRRALLRPAARTIGAFAVTLVALALILDRMFPLPLPNLNRDAATVVLARDGEPLRAFADARGVWRYPLTVSEVPSDYLQALLHFEDRRFRHHVGIDPLALLRASWQAIRYRRIVSGASTLTMQVARLIDPTPRSLLGKLRQALRALQLEWHLDKDQILALYVNYAPFGGTLEGAQAASYGYFGKPLARISAAEAALLAVLPQAPSRLRPDRHADAARRARDKVLDRLAVHQIWDARKIAEAREEPVIARQLRPPVIAALAAQRLRDSFPNQRRIQSTLDAELQRRLEERVGAWVATLPPRSSAAVLVADTRTLEIRAYVGAGRFADGERFGHLDMVTAWRSPGSTLKPFLYGLAIDDGLIHSRSLLVDAPQEFDGYMPGNFDGRYRGPVDATRALQQSLNVPAVALLQALGPERFAARLAHAGLPLRLPAGARPNLAMILGGTEARLEDLVAAFASLQSDGITAPLRLTPDNDATPRTLLSAGAAWIVRDILHNAPRPGEAADRFDTSSRPALAWKTGTSYGFRDAWAIGSSAGASIGVWVGRPDGTPSPGHYGAISALPLLLAIADSLPRELRADPSPRPQNVSTREICWPLGRDAIETQSAHCARKLEAVVLDASLPPTLARKDEATLDPYLRYQRDRQTGLRVNQACREEHTRELIQIARWPTLTQPWLSQSERESQRLPPLASDCSESATPSAQLRITGAIDGSRIRRPSNSERPLQLELRALGAQGEVRWLANGKLVGQTERNAVLHLAIGQPGPLVMLALDARGAYGRVAVEVVP